jgi:hypothetical protein
VSLLVAVSLMGFIMIAQHNYQLKFAPVPQGNTSTIAVSSPETIALK